MIMNGTVNNMTISGQNSTLGISFKSTNNGMLTIRLPRDIIDSKTPQGSDTGFNVFIDNAELVEPNENATTSNMRTLSIGFPAGSQAIDIIGTKAVPEFSTIAVVVMAVAIIGIIMATAKHSKFNFTRRL
jgi:predicted secreted protein with PEFG-CTERM motif